MLPKKKLLFVQLPIPRLSMTREDHNIPVAAFYLHSYLLEHPITTCFEMQILDPDVQNYGSDETILQAMRAFAPDVLCFSLFCWNVERSLYLAEQIKNPPFCDGCHHPPLILAGGPEVTPDNSLLQHSAIDLYVYGEGEYTLLLILEAWLAKTALHSWHEHIPGTMYAENDEWRVNPPQEHAVDINTTTPAYLKGIVPRTNWNEMFVETMRGCPFSCRFCYYNKNCGAIRYLKRETVLQLVQYAIEQQYREIFLLDPSFNIRPDLEELLREIAHLNHDRPIKIATELRADLVDEHLAYLLAAAGIYEVELGLQSIHPDTIQQIGRTQHLDAFLRGTRAMLKRGIETKVDLIVGLPGDSLEKFKQSARWVKREGLDASLQVFCLSILPGTYFRQYAEALGIKYCPLPPYYLLSSPDWSEEDLKTAFSWAEDYFGISFEPDLDDELTLQPFDKLRAMQVQGADGEPVEPQEIVYVHPYRSFQRPAAAANITKWVVGPIHRAEDLMVHLPAMQHYTRANPYGIYLVYIELHQEIPLEAIVDFYTAFASLKQHFLDRDFSVLSIHNAQISHYRLEILLKRSRLPHFSVQYREALQQHFYIEVI